MATRDRERPPLDPYGSRLPRAAVHLADGEAESGRDKGSTSRRLEQVALGLRTPDEITADRFRE